MTSRRDTTARTVSILVVDDIRWLRDGIATMLRARGLRGVKTARDGDDALRQLPRVKPHLVLLDSSRERGTELVDALKRLSPAAQIVVVGIEPERDDVVDFIRAGATGFILKDATADEFIATVRTAADGAAVLPPRVASRVCEYVASSSGAARPETHAPGLLTHRERDVCALIADGHGNKEIADRLHISTDTVKSHVHSILAKFGVHTRLQIATHAHAAPDVYTERLKPRE